ncbi:FecR domain-containing protein [Cyanobium sp. FACHB-13342]|nr:FecR domain-containing protein [Cyanobium sp. FACHB-13342]
MVASFGLLTGRLSSLLALLLTVPSAALAAPAVATSATVQQILDGKELYIDARQAVVQQKASAPQDISTGQSRGQLAFTSGAVGRLNRHSQLQLGDSCFLLSKGQILVSGAQSGCTRSSRLSVRGTNYLLEVNDNQEAELSVLEGSVEVETLQNGEPTGAAPTRVEAGQKLRLSPQGVILTLLKLSSGDYTGILNGPLFEGFSIPLPAMGALDSYIRANVPGVSIPGMPGIPGIPSAPSVPSFGLPRFF